jgi:hypothetical protein
MKHDLQAFEVIAEADVIVRSLKLAVVAPIGVAGEEVVLEAEIVFVDVKTFETGLADPALVMRKSLGPRDDVTFEFPISPGGRPQSTARPGNQLLS